MSGARQRTRLGVLISGGGRTALNLLERSESGLLDAEIVLAIASRADIPGVTRLRERGLAVEIVARDGHQTQAQLHDRTDDLLLGAGVELVCCCGWLRHVRVRGAVVDWSQRCLNIHPSLLPRHGGKGMHGDRVHAAVLAAGERETGCTVHYVDELYDHGPIILQRRVEVLPGDDVVSLAVRVFAAECAAYPEAIALHLEGKPPCSPAPRQG
jgi:formyltetrahydrofolate-dependent phosphoribosylglycinamide formyltransferase